MYSFGPVHSRRLGYSLGINNIPPKHCSYSCTYCQVGKTDNFMSERRAFFQPEAIVEDAKRRIGQVSAHGGKIDYISFVPDGEPTLDVNLGREISLLKPLGHPLALFTNCSMIWRDDVREELANLDWISLKLDSPFEHIWRKINRPVKDLHLNQILEGMIAFAVEFKGILTTETMLVKGVNDSEKNVRGVADFLERLHPAISYLSIPTRPTAEPQAAVPEEAAVNQAYQILNQSLDHVECLITEDDDEYGFTGDAEDDILRTTAVHPMSEAALEKILEKSHARWDTIHRLIAGGHLIEMTRGDQRFYLRRFSRKCR